MLGNIKSHPEMMVWTEEVYGLPSELSIPASNPDKAINGLPGVSQQGDSSLGVVPRTDVKRASHLSALVGGHSHI